MELFTMHTQNLLDIMGIMIIMVITRISIMQTDIYMMNINMNNKIIAIFFLLTITSCSLAPGMHMSSSTTWLDDEETIFIESINKEIKILNIYSEANTQPMNKSYLIGIGDQIAITIWGLPEIFPITNINPDSNLRRVDSNGNIFSFMLALFKLLVKPNIN